MAGWGGEGRDDALSETADSGSLSSSSPTVPPRKKKPPPKRSIEFKLTVILGRKGDDVFDFDCDSQLPVRLLSLPPSYRRHL